MAASLMGRTMPLVPKMEIPPSMPKRGLKVRFANRSPSGTEMVIRSPWAAPAWSRAALTCSAIIRRGVELMAAAPGG